MACVNQNRCGYNSTKKIANRTWKKSNWNGLAVMRKRIQQNLVTIMILIICAVYQSKVGAHQASATF